MKVIDFFGCMEHKTATKVGKGKALAVSQCNTSPSPALAARCKGDCPGIELCKSNHARASIQVPSLRPCVPAFAVGGIYICIKSVQCHAHLPQQINCSHASCQKL